MITEEQVENRKYWIDEISRSSGDFGADAEWRTLDNKVQKVQSVAKNGILDLEAA